MAKLGMIKYLKATHGSNKHEHNFKIEITLIGKIKNDFVEGIDFHDISKTIDIEIDKMSNKYLNDYLGKRASVENIAIYLFNTLKMCGIDNIYAIKIFEEENRYIEVNLSDL